MKKLLHSIGNKSLRLYFHIQFSKIIKLFTFLGSRNNKSNNTVNSKPVWNIMVNA